MSTITYPKASLEVKYLPYDFLEHGFKEQLRIKLKAFMPSGHSVDENLVDYVTLIVGSGREKQDLVNDLGDFFGRKKSIDFVQWMWDTLTPIIQYQKSKAKVRENEINKKNDKMKLITKENEPVITDMSSDTKTSSQNKINDDNSNHASIKKITNQFLTPVILLKRRKPEATSGLKLNLLVTTPLRHIHQVHCSHDKTKKKGKLKWCQQLQVKPIEN